MAVTLRQRRIWKSQTRWRVEGGMDVDGFLGRSRSDLEAGECEQGKCVLSLQKVIPRPTGGVGDIQTDRGRKIRGRQSKAKKGYRIPDGSWVMWEFFIFLLVFFVFESFSLPPLSLLLFLLFSFTWMQQWYSLILPLNCFTTARHSFSKLLIHKQCMFPHTPVQALTHTRPQPPSLLDLLSYLRTLYSFPPSGNSFHVNTTSIYRAALSLHTSIHCCAAYLSHLQGKQMVFILHCTSPLRSPPPQCVCGSLHTAQRLIGSCYTTVCVGMYCIRPAEGLLSKTLSSSWSLKRG